MSKKYNKKDIGQKIKIIRLKKGMTLEEFGKLFNTSKGIISRWENGISTPTPERLKKIAELGGVSVAYMMGLTDDKSIKTAIVPQEEIEKGIELFNIDFINFLKYHDLYLTDNQINTAINMLFSMSNINNDFLNYLFSKNDLERIDIEKNRNYKNLFSYSSLWSINYETLVFKKQKEEKS